MGKIRAHIQNFLQPAVFFIPFTFYFILFAAGAIAGYEWLLNKQQFPGTSFSDIFSLLLKVAGWFVLTILALAFISVVLAAIYFYWQKRNKELNFSVNSSNSVQTKAGIQQQRISVEISPLIKPFLGFIKLRLKYDDKFTEKFSLSEHATNRFFSITYSGDYVWTLPEIKEYHLVKLVIYFEDFFQFFSFAAILPVQNRFYTQPLSHGTKDVSISPRKTETTATRIEELKKVEGEFLNYKNFEDNDDVRRIVWKIYAKNKELVVRIPEILDPYASHAYMYASYFTDFNLSGNQTAEIFFLNYYKTMLWAIYEKLWAQGFEVRYVADQQTAAKRFNDEKQAVQYSISTSKWQREKDLKTYVKTKDASILIVSSFVNAAQAEDLLSNSDGNTFFIFVKLSASLEKSYWLNFLQWLFIQQEKNEVEVYKTKWHLSLLRSKVLQNEKKLEILFAKYNKTLVI